MPSFLQEMKTKHRQEKLALANTKICAQMYREALANEMHPDLIHELYLLLVASAKDEWGQDTAVDDFSEPPLFIVTSGKRVEKI